MNKQKIYAGFFERNHGKDRERKKERKCCQSIAEYLSIANSCVTVINHTVILLIWFPFGRSGSIGIQI